MAEDDPLSRYKSGRYDPDTVLPFPELIDGKPTTFIPTTGLTGTAVGMGHDGQQRLSAPQDPPDLALRLQMHEEAHRKWSPMEDGKSFRDYAKKAKIDPMIVAALEDTRVNVLTNQVTHNANADAYQKWLHSGAANLPGACWKPLEMTRVWQETRLLSERDFRTIRQQAQLQRILAYCAVMHTADATVEVDGKDLDEFLLDRNELMLAREVLAKIFDDPLNFDAMLKAGQHLAKRLGEWDKAKEEAKRRVNEMAGSGSMKMSKAYREAMEQAALKAMFDPTSSAVVNSKAPKKLTKGPAVDVLKDFNAKTTKATRQVVYTSGDSGGPRWAPMSIVTPPLTVPYRPKAKDRTKRYRSQEEGHHLRRLDRFLSDGRIFGTKKVEKAASVLIDASGSMGFSAQDIYNMLSVLPAVRVAMYCGVNTKGFLTILAKDGRMVGKIDRQGHNNSCDGLALRWLAQQPGPRIWISDGYVTGPSDECRADLTIDAANVCKMGKIVRVETVEEAIRLLKLRRGL